MVLPERVLEGPIAQALLPTAPLGQTFGPCNNPRHRLLMRRHSVENVAIQCDGVPRLESLEQPKLRSRMPFDVIIESVDKRAIQRLKSGFERVEVVARPLGISNRCVVSSIAKTDGP